MTRFGAIVFASLLLPGCATWGTHSETVAMCERGFANDPDWSRIARPGKNGRMLWRTFTDIEFEGHTMQPAKASTLWFRNKVNQEIGTCSMHSCDTGRCLWRVRLFDRHPDGWQLRSGYDLAKPPR